MNIIDLSSICIDSMKSMLDNDCDFNNCDILFCDGKHYYSDVNVQLRATPNRDSYLIVFTVKN